MCGDVTVVIIILGGLFHIKLYMVTSNTPYSILWAIDKDKSFHVCIIFEGPGNQKLWVYMFSMCHKEPTLIIVVVVVVIDN